VERLPDLTADAARVARAALEEDGPIDLTTEVVLAASRETGSSIEYRQRSIVAGLAYATAVARLVACHTAWQPAGRAAAESKSRSPGAVFLVCSTRQPVPSTAVT